jgi:hypothetical protein
MGQHTVSKFLLKRFADKGDVAVFDRRYGRRQRRSFGSRIFETTFDAHDPKRSESMWGSVETRAGITIRRLESGLPLKSDDEQTLRDLMAVHWARSRAIMTARDAITEGIVEDSKRKTLEARPHLLVQAYLTEVGLIPTTSAQLEWINDLAHGRVVAAGVDQWHSERNVVNLREAMVGKLSHLGLLRTRTGVHLLMRSVRSLVRQQQRGRFLLDCRVLPRTWCLV